MTHGLVVRDPSQSSSDAYNVSRLGRETLKYGVARLAAGERLGVALHPRLAQRIQQQFLLGEFELAVFAAMKEVEVRVRELAQAAQSLFGVKLMQHAFSAEKGALTDADADPGEQVAMMELSKGAIGLFKNPTSHRPWTTTIRRWPRRSSCSPTCCFGCLTESSSVRPVWNRARSRSASRPLQRYVRGEPLRRMHECVFGVLALESEPRGFAPLT
jgi:uncharacterized protein (TIGR02391 family)